MLLFSKSISYKDIGENDQLSFADSAVHWVHGVLNFIFQHHWTSLCSNSSVINSKFMCSCKDDCKNLWNYVCIEVLALFMPLGQSSSISYCCSKIFMSP